MRTDAVAVSRTGSPVIRLDATDSDIAALNSLSRRGVRVGNESPDKDLHLDEMIPKPWGQEYRAYADDFLDIWHLQIDPGHSTSMHVHPRKTTYLLCLSGSGVTRTLKGVHGFGRGAVIRIGRGSFHSTENTASSEPLMIIEVETPRNKFDLMRLQDSYARAGKGYEQASHAAGVAAKRVPYLPHARMCRTSPDGSYAFEILAGMDVYYRRHSAAAYLIPLDFAGLVNDHIAILTDHPQDVRKPNLDGYYLGIRRVLPSHDVTKP
jgi:mannose-6-phosphate isomerase-like protein (cupin superfamily)